MTAAGSQTRPEAPGYCTNTPKSSPRAATSVRLVEVEPTTSSMPTASARGLEQRLVCGRASASTTKRFDADFERAAGDQHALDDGGGLVEHRRVRRVEPGEVGDHRLEVDERLEAALRDLGLVRRVRRVPGRVLEHVALDHRRRDRAVVAEADHRAGARGSARRARAARRAPRPRSRRAGSPSRHLSHADGCGHRRLHERVDGVVAEGVEHPLVVVRGGADVTTAEGVGVEGGGGGVHRAWILTRRRGRGTRRG